METGKIHGSRTDGQASVETATRGQLHNLCGGHFAQSREGAHWHKWTVAQPNVTFDKKTSPARRVSKFSFTRCMVQSSRTPQVFQSHEQATTPTFACGLSVGLQVGQVRGLASRSGCRGRFAGNTSVAWIYRVATFLSSVLASVSNAGTSRRKQEGRQPTQKHTKAAVTTRTPSLADRWTRRSLVAMSRCTTFAVPTSSNGQTICTIKIILICATYWPCASDTARMFQLVSQTRCGKSRDSGSTNA